MCISGWSASAPFPITQLGCSAHTGGPVPTQGMAWLFAAFCPANTGEWEARCSRRQRPSWKQSRREVPCSGARHRTYQSILCLSYWSAWRQDIPYRSGACEKFPQSNSWTFSWLPLLDKTIHFLSHWFTMTLSERFQVSASYRYWRLSVQVLYLKHLWVNHCLIHL